MKRNIYGVYFVCCMGNYKQIIREQLHSIKKSGLLEKTTELLCFICEFDIEVMKLFQPFHTKIKFITTKENLYEKFALQNFRHYVNRKKPYYMYYFHTKGVSHYPIETPPPLIDEKGNAQWRLGFYNVRRNLDYFILEKHDICIWWMEHGYDVVGTALSLYPTLHFSGNFWWATSEHLDKLPIEIRPTYYGAEMYICSQPNGSYMSICQHTNTHSLEKLCEITDTNIIIQSTSIPLDNLADKDIVY